MKVYAQEGETRFLIDPQDGNPKGVVVYVNPDDPETLQVYPRATHIESILRFGLWEAPDPVVAAKVSAIVQGRKFPPVPSSAEEVQANG